MEYSLITLIIGCLIAGIVFVGLYLIDKYEEYKVKKEKYMIKEDVKKDVAIVFCEDCGVCIKKDKATKVVETYKTSLLDDKTLYYCSHHAKKYDKTINNLFNKTIYLKTFEVDKDGKIIK